MSTKDSKNIRGVYLYSKTIDYNNISGVIKKIHSQVNAFKKNGLDCSLCYFTTLKNLWKAPCNNCAKNDSNDIRNANVLNIDYIYIRKPGVIDLFFILLIRTIRKKNRKIKMVIEIPTYPYDLEFKNGFVGLLKYMVDRFYRSQLHKYVDYIAVLSDDKFVFNIKTLKIDNGFDFSNCMIRDLSSFSDASIDMCAIAKFDFWHGYERLLYGLSNYYRDFSNKKLVYLHMVGDGVELPKYKSIVNNLGIGRYVKFYGFLNDCELRKVYNICDVSIGSLALYKKNIFDTCELKSTEALAYGIPYACGCNSTRLTNHGYNYYLELPNDNTPINVSTIVNFVDELYKNEDVCLITKNIREFGEKHFTTETCMKNVINYFKN